MISPLYYCFVSEDIHGLPLSDALYIQFLYAQCIDRCLICCLTTQEVTDTMGKKVCIDGYRILLRATCDTVERAMTQLGYLGANLVETPGDIALIKQWNDLQISKRKVISTTCLELLTTESKDEIMQICRDTDYVFLKTQNKGFSLKTSTQRLLSNDKTLRDFISLHTKGQNCTLLLSPWYDIKHDSLGSMEIRCIVIDNSVRNISRAVHTVKHAVPKTLREAAYKLVDQIRATGSFPSSFVLDIALFCYSDGLVADIVEINPLSTAMCYINNSIFDYLMDECKAIYEQTKWGYEYCFDAYKHPEKYHIERYSGITYQYATADRFTLI